MNKPVSPEGFAFTQASMHRRERRPMSVKAKLATAGGVAGDALILDLSYDGCGIQTPVRLTNGESVIVHVSGARIPAQVRWCANGTAGLAFEKQNRPQAAIQSRVNDERVLLNVTATLRRLGMPAYRVNVSDLSPQGCKVDVVERPRVGEHLLIKFDGLDAIEAEVCWITDYSAGLQFERPIHPAVFDLLLVRLGPR